MITQKFNQDKNEIRIESAESINDAKANGFEKGIYSRYFVNDKPVKNYQAMIRFIVDESQKNNSRFIPDEKNAVKMRNQMLENKNKEMKDFIDDLRNKYKAAGMDTTDFDNYNEMLKKMNSIGVMQE